MNIYEAQLYQAIADTEVSFGCEKEFNIVFDTKDEEIVGVTFQFIAYENRLWEWVHEKKGREPWMYSSFRDESKDTILEKKFSWKELCSYNPYSIDTWIRNMAYDMEKEMLADIKKREEENKKNINPDYLEWERIKKENGWYLLLND